MQYAMLGVLLGLMILYFVYFYFKNKREKENYKNVLDNIKEGTNVLTSAGIIGKVVSIQEKDSMKTITIETGNDNKKGYLTFDIQAIYMVLDPVNTNNELQSEKLKDVVENDIKVENQEVNENQEHKEPKKKNKKEKK